MRAGFASISDPLRSGRVGETFSHCRVTLDLGRRLVRLERGAACTELLCFFPRVFEPRAGVCVDELTGFDPLEAVPL
jgi:hypothetical protein